MHQDSTASVQTGRPIKRVSYPAILRTCAQLLKKTSPQSESVAKNDGFAAEDLSTILPEAESHRGICAHGGRRAPHFALPANRDCEKSAQSKKTAAASEQNSRVGKEPVVFAF